MKYNQSIAQIQLPDPNDMDPHPRLVVDGWGLHAGESYEALFPDGWHRVTFEIKNEVIGPACWYISTDGFRDICPVGLFVRV